MHSAEIREKFLSFFESKGHLRHSSSSLVPDDPTLLTTSAGMVQFKPYFLGHRKPPHTRLTTSQKCFRAVDIEEVGRTPRHHTFFEMLGNFSFGDYFKEEIITWAWEFLTEWLKLDPTRLKISVYKDDDEAADIWQKKIGIPAERFFRLGEDDNYWPAGAPSKGPNGPCGPCSEIFWDFGPERGCGKPGCGDITCDCNRHVEIWNLVFMQYERKEGGEMIPLPMKNIDTGSGLERLASVLQGTLTNFETDLFLPIIRNLESITGGNYEATPVPFRVIADHIRGAAFLISDGVFPSNEGRGYVLRKILRRAAQNGIELGIGKPFLSSALDTVVEIMGTAYPEIKEKTSFIANIITKEEEQFAEALSLGSVYLINALKNAPEKANKAASGQAAFTAYDTYGLPIEEAEKIVRELGFEGIDTEEFKAAMEEQKDRSRKGSKMDGEVFAEDAEKVYRESLEGRDAGKFEGYKKIKAKGTIISMVVNGAKVESASAGTVADIITDTTPFYGEMGGQVGDHGIIKAKSTKATVIESFVIDGKIVVHRSMLEKGILNVGDKVSLVVDAVRRADIMRHHTATHLLHAALRQTLGTHVVQSGSYVGPDKLRFDFTHHSGIDRDTLQKIEDIVNRKVMECLPVKTTVTDFATAKKTGAMALFGEKYGDSVRMVTVPGFSSELCGGTHTASTGTIGPFKITDERAIGSSLRRIEAVAGERAVEFINHRFNILDQSAAILKTNDEQLQHTIENIVAEKDKLAKELKKSLAQKAQNEAKDALEGAETIGGASVFVKRFENLGRDAMLSVFDGIKAKVQTYAVLIGAEDQGKVQFLAAFSDDLVEKGFDAGAIVKQVAQVAGGGGGGKKNMAQAGARDVSKIPDALDLGKKLIVEKLA